MLFVVSINKKMRNYFSLIVFFNLAGPFARDQFKYSLLTQVKHVIFYGALFDLKNFSLYAFKSSIA